MSSTLPLEIVEYVIDEAQEDISSLRSLSLTCHHLLPRCRYHLFQTITFKNRTELHDIYDLFASKPHLRALIRFIVVRAVPGVPHCLTLLEIVPVPLLSLLPNLRGWTLSTKGRVIKAGKWSSFSNRTLACLRRYSSLIRTLRISSVHFRTCSELARLMVAFNGLEDLLCTDIQFQCEGHISESLKQRLSSQLNLNCLSLHGVQGCATSLLTQYSCSSLRELDLDIAPRPEGTSVTNLPNFSRLERISLVINHAGTGRDGLRNSFSAVRSTLASFYSWTLKHLTMRLDYTCTPPLGDQEVLLESLELEKFLLERKLETIVISLVNARRHRKNLQYTVRSYEMCFPTLSRRGLLNIIPEVDIRTAGHESPVAALAVSADSRFVASSSETTIIIWDTRTHRATREWRVDSATHGTDILAFSPSCTHHCLASCGGELGHIALWDVIQGRLLAVLTGHFQRVETCVWSPDGTRLASSTGYGGVLVWDAETYTQLHTLHHHYAAVRCVLFSPDGQWVVTGSAKGVVRVWDVATGAKLADVPHRDAINTMAYHPDGVRIAIAFGGASGVCLFHVNVNAEERSQQPEEVLLLDGQDDQGIFMDRHEEQTIAFSRDGRRLLWAGPISARSQDLGPFRGVWWRVWDMLSGRALSQQRSINYLWPFYVASFSSDGGQVAIGGTGDGKVRVCNLRKKEESPVETFTEHNIRVGECSVTHVTFSPDGAILASGARDGSVFIRRVRDVSTLP